MQGKQLFGITYRLKSTKTKKKEWKIRKKNQNQH